MMKKTICIFLILGFLFLTGCKDNSLPMDEVIAETDSHMVFRSGEDYYIEFYDEHDNKTENESQTETGVKFSSLEDLRSAILHTGLEAHQIEKVRLNETKPVKIFNIVNMFQVSDVNITEVKWYGEYYSCIFNTIDETGNTVLGSASFGTSEHSKKYYQQLFENKIESLDDTYVITNLNDRNATEYRGKNDMYIVYTLESQGRKIIIQEEYTYYEYQANPSDTIPWIIHMYIQDSDMNWSIGLTNFTSRPTEEWLLSFGMEPFVPEE